MANKITVLLDLVTDKATATAKGFKKSIADAEGAANKFKAGASSAFATVQANAGALALGAGTALAAFGAKSVEAFTSGALAAGKFSEATGLAVEDASKLQEVASDLGISNEAVAGTLVRLQKAVASNSDAVKELGIETKRTADGQTDVLGTYLDAIDRLGGVEDANQRALLASQLFGKGFADSAELVLGSADDIKARLEEVSGAQVFDADEVAKAKRFHDTMDDLRDSFEQISLTVGESLVPALSDAAVLLTDISELGKDIGDVPGFDALQSAVTDTLNPVGFLVDKYGDAKDAITGAGDAAAETATQVDRAADSVSTAAVATDELAGAARRAGADFHAMGLGIADGAEATEDFINDAIDAVDEFNESFINAANEGAQEFQDALQGVLDKVDEVAEGVHDRINMEGMLDDITAQFRAVQEAADEAAENGKEGTAQYREEVRRLRLMLLDLVGDLDNLSANDKIRLVTEIERGSLDELFAIVGELSKGITIPVVFNTPQQAFSGTDFVFGNNAIPNTIFQNPNPAPVDNSQTTIIYPVGTTPTSVTVDRRLYDSRNGAAPR